MRSSPEIGWLAISVESTLAPMSLDDAQLQATLTLENYPLSAKYSARWLVNNLMGPNPEDAYDVVMLRDDTQQSLGFTRIAAHRCF